jgi:hypothetical protein
MSSKIKVGDEAQDFTLPDTNMKPRSLKEFTGKKVVLAFLLVRSRQRVQKKCVNFVIPWLGLSIWMLKLLE